MNEHTAQKIAAEHDAGKHKAAARFDCWACGARLSAPVKRESLYPDRELVFCQRCRCEHFEGGRCFAADPVGWPIVREIVRAPRAFAARMTPAETQAVVKDRKSAPRRWWT